jgi:hypothetical protein
MPASKQKYIMGERYYKGLSEVTKSIAMAWADKERKRGYKARLEKIKRGNYTVWSTRQM